jgi:hypothetical protein
LDNKDKAIQALAEVSCVTIGEDTRKPIVAVILIHFQAVHDPVQGGSVDSEQF